MPATLTQSQLATPRNRPEVEDGQDVLLACCDIICAQGEVCLVIVSATEGGAVRAPGAMMAVAPDGSRIGYLSGGCIDADAAFTAQSVIDSGQLTEQIYGAGSDRRDLSLPCGGSIKVIFWPMDETNQIDAVLAKLSNRKATELTLPNGLAFHLKPKLRLRLAGRGVDLLAMARLGQGAGYELIVQTPDAECVADLRAEGFNPIDLVTPDDLPEADDDQYTAFILLFHDPDWETPLLKQALAGPVFYIGAVGSARAQTRRVELLSEAGVKDTSRIHGPIGLAPSMRNATSLALSTLAEVAALYEGLAL